MKSLLRMLLLVCVLTGSSSRRAEAADSQVLPRVTAAATSACDVDDLVCFRLALLQKQDEVLSLGKRIGLQEQHLQLMKDGLQMVIEQRDIAIGGQKVLMEAAGKLVPHWYESPWLWFGIGVFIGGGLVVLSAFAVAQALAH